MSGEYCRQLWCFMTVVSYEREQIADKISFFDLRYCSILGGGCYNTSEQRSCGPWEKSDGQR